MLHQGAQRNYIEKRVNLPTAKSSAEIARDVPPGIRARAFFSARACRRLMCWTITAQRWTTT